jgi:hypothetical protein
VGGGGVDDAGARFAAFFLERVDHGHGLHCSIVVQAKHDQVGLSDESALGAGVFAQGGVNADQFHAGKALQPFPDLQAGGASFAINKYFLHNDYSVWQLKVVGAAAWSRTL